MAKIGCKFLTVAPYDSTNQDGAAPTYGAEVAVEYLNSIDVNFEYADAELPGDDMIRESDRSLTGYSVASAVTDLAPEVAAAMLAWKKHAEGNGYTVTGKNTPYMGFGFVQSGMVNGVKYFEGLWFYKAQFTKDSISARTKDRNITFNTDSITGRGMPVILDESGDDSWYEIERFDTEIAAKAFMKSFIKRKS